MRILPHDCIRPFPRSLCSSMQLTCQQEGPSRSLEIEDILIITDEYSVHINLPYLLGIRYWLRRHRRHFSAMHLGCKLLQVLQEQTDAIWEKLYSLQTLPTSPTHPAAYNSPILVTSYLPLSERARGSWSDDISEDMRLSNPTRSVQHWVTLKTLSTRWSPPSSTTCTRI